MTTKWKEFSLSDIDSSCDYEFKFQDGHTETWYGGELIDASESQGCIFIFQITDMRKLGRPSAEEIQARMKESDDFQKTLKWAAIHSAERRREVMDKANLSLGHLRELSKEKIRERFAKERKRFPDYSVELDFLETVALRDSKENY